LRALHDPMQRSRVRSSPPKGAIRASAELRRTTPFLFALVAKIGWGQLETHPFTTHRPRRTRHSGGRRRHAFRQTPAAHAPPSRRQRNTRCFNPADEPSAASLPAHWSAAGARGGRHAAADPANATDDGFVESAKAAGEAARQSAGSLGERAAFRHAAQLGAVAGDDARAAPAARAAPGAGAVTRSSTTSPPISRRSTGSVRSRIPRWHS